MTTQLQFIIIIIIIIIIINYVPIIRRTYCYLYDTGIFHSVWAAVWSQPPI